MARSCEIQIPGNFQKSLRWNQIVPENAEKRCHDCLIELGGVETRHIAVQPVKLSASTNFAILEGDQAVITPFSLLNSTWSMPQVLQEASEDCSVPEHCIEDIYPCSPMQEGLLALLMKHPGSYILQFWYQMPKFVNLDKIKAAWETVAKRTPVLRTRLFYYNSDLLQVVVNEPPIWEVFDEGFAEFYSRDRNGRMNLGEPLSRLTVLRQPDSTQCYLIWTVHHALADESSESSIVTQVEQEYLGRSPAILTNPMFNSFIKHIRQQQQQQETAQEFWRQQLIDAPRTVFPPLPDPTYIPKVQQSNGGFPMLTISREKAELEHKVTFFKGDSVATATMIQAAWSLLVGMYLNVSDVVTGVALNGLTSDISCINLIPGPTVTTLPFRTRFTPDQKVSDFLQSIQETYFAMLPFAHFGLRNIRRSSKHAFTACNFRSLLVVNSVRYSRRLADQLRSYYNIEPESFVMVCFEKSLWAIVSMLAVLMAGGTCVPINPQESAEQLQTMIRTLGENSANLVLTSPSYSERLKGLGVGVLPIQLEMIVGFVDTGLVCSKPTPSNAAFVTFTSGTTDGPKGVVLEHQALSSSALAWGHFLNFSSQSRVFLSLPFTSHVSIGDIFSTLIYGGCICIPSEHDGISNLSEAINSLEANHLTLTPTVACFLRPEGVPNVNILVATGETVTKELIETWADHVNFINMYGCVECTFCCTAKAGIKRHDRASNIGKGVGPRTWIVSSEDPNRLTSIGGVGEILIEGPILARGYLGDESQTESNFIEDPAWARFNSSTTKRRFYKTGDLASYNSDGSLVLVGREIEQVQLHGQRLEVEEVETVLRKIFPPSRGVAVVVVCPKNGEPKLAAFLVMNGDEEENTEQPLLASFPKASEQFQDILEGLEMRLSSHLPSYMIPSLYIPIREIPLLASYKLDRKALQSLASKFSLSELSGLMEHRTTTRSYIPPSTRTERRVHDLWKSLLKTDQIGMDDNFFDLGGSSILAMRLVSMARKEGMALTVNGIFESPNLRDLALTVRENISAVDIPPFALLGDLDVPVLRNRAALQCGIRERDIEDIYPCSAMQQHYVTGYPEAMRNPSGPWEWKLQLVRSFPQSINLDRFRAVWDSAIRRHPTLRTRLINSPFGIFQVVLKEPGFPKWTKVGNLTQYLDRDRSDNMTFGDRLLRLATVECKNTGERFFVMTIHHTIYDAFSQSILFKELETAYFGGSIEPPLSKMNQFIKYITEADKATATDFWTSRLADAITKPLLTPPEDYIAIYQIGKTMNMDIPTLHGSECTLPTMIEVASGLAIAQTLKCADVIFYSDRSGRNLSVDGIQDLVGPTTLFLPVRIHVDKGQKVRDLLRDS